MRHAEVGALLESLGLPRTYLGYGYELGLHHRLQKGGGIACDDRWTLIRKTDWTPIGRARTRRELRRLLLEWMAGERPRARAGYILYARWHHNRFGDGAIWVQRRANQNHDSEES